MEGEASAVVQEEESGAWFYVAKVGWEILAKGFLVDGADAEFVSDTVFRTHQFCIRAVSQLISLLGNFCSGLSINLCRKLVRYILLICNLVKWQLTVAFL